MQFAELHRSFNPSGVSGKLVKDNPKGQGPLCSTTFTYQLKETCLYVAFKLVLFQSPHMQVPFVKLTQVTEKRDE